MSKFLESLFPTFREMESRKFFEDCVTAAYILNMCMQTALVPFYNAVQKHEISHLISCPRLTPIPFHFDSSSLPIFCWILASIKMERV